MMVWAGKNGEVSFLLLFLQGTNIAAGKCRGIVIGTGLETEIGLFPFCMLFVFLTALLFVRFHFCANSDLIIFIV